MNFPDPDDISPEDFERLVKNWFDSCRGELSSFKSTHREVKQGYDGDYEIDVAISFQIFDGAKIDVIVECKKYKNPIGRELIQVLKDKKDSIGSHKAFLVSTSRFQSGAIEYASKHGIALIQVVDGRVMYIQANTKLAREIPKNADKLAGLLWIENPEGKLALPMCFTEQRCFTLEYYLEGGWTHNKQSNNAADS